MQEYEELKVMVAEIESDVDKANAGHQTVCSERPQPDS